jgi:cytoskeletal protein CcmA (bactofilin family)
MKKNRFIRSSTLGIFCISMSMTSGAFADYDEESEYENSKYIPIVYSGAAVTMGADSSVFGDVQSVSAITLGDSAVVNGSVLAGAAVTIERAGVVTFDVRAGDAATLGANATVFGNLAARAAVFIGAESEVSGELTSGGDVKLGAAAKVGGNVTATTSVTLGAHAEVGNYESAGNVQAVHGSVVLGGYSTVKGDAQYGTVISLGDNAIVEGNEIQSYPGDFINHVEAPLASKREQLIQKQQKFADMLVPTNNELATTIDADRDFEPGVYHATGLTTTADITLTFRGSPTEQPEHWVINVDTYISFGAKMKIELVDVALGSTIIFNSGTYTTIGANSIVRGTLLAGTYITAGANTTIHGIGPDCGGMFATNGAITMGAGSTFGEAGCWPVEQQNDNADEHDGSEGSSCGDESNDSNESNFGDESNEGDEYNYSDESNCGDESNEGNEYHYWE